MNAPASPPDVLWFRNCGARPPQHDLTVLRTGLKKGWLDEQDEYGMSALSLCVSSQWLEGAEELLRAGASTLVRYHRTGETMLYMATLAKDEAFIALLLAHGADPDEPNYWGMTPRRWRPAAFEHIPRQSRPLPAPRIQNAEHLADNHFPNFKIAGRGERESLQPGQAVDLVVYGPQIEGKGDRVKARITDRTGVPPGVRYAAAVETPIERTHLANGTTTVEFGPEHVATVYIRRPAAKG